MGIAKQNLNLFSVEKKHNFCEFLIAVSANFCIDYFKDEIIAKIYLSFFQGKTHFRDRKLDLKLFFKKFSEEHKKQVLIVRRTSFYRF